MPRSRWARWARLAPLAALGLAGCARPPDAAARQCHVLLGAGPGTRDHAYQSEKEGFCCENSAPANNGWRTAPSRACCERAPQARQECLREEHEQAWDARAVCEAVGDKRLCCVHTGGLMVPTDAGGLAASAKCCEEVYWKTRLDCLKLEAEALKHPPRKEEARLFGAGSRKQVLSTKQQREKQLKEDREQRERLQYLADFGGHGARVFAELAGALPGGAARGAALGGSRASRGFTGPGLPGLGERGPREAPERAGGAAAFAELDGRLRPPGPAGVAPVPEAGRAGVAPVPEVGGAGGAPVPGGGGPAGAARKPFRRETVARLAAARRH